MTIPTTVLQRKSCLECFIAWDDQGGYAPVEFGNARPSNATKDRYRPHFKTFVASAT